MTTPLDAEAREIAANLSAFARFTINGGGGAGEWYGRTERAAEEIEQAGLARRPFSHDRSILVPTALGLAVRAILSEQGK